MENKVCVVCGSEATNTCYHCQSAYCDIHYERVVMTGNCCSDNEKDYE